MQLRVLVALSVTTLLAAACDKKADAPAEPAAAPAVAAAPVEAAPTAAPAPTEAAPTEAAPTEAAPAAAAPEEKPACEGGAACGDAAEKKVETGCEAVDAAQLKHTEVEAVTRPDGTSGVHAGGAFAGVTVVKVSELLADPNAYAGKSVAIEGDVSAMCQHRRGWFSIVAEDKSGRFVRVVTAPDFLVPVGSIGKTAKAEGVVEVIEVEQKHAQHLAGEHKLGDPAEIAANIQQVVLRASGAEFF